LSDKGIQSIDDIKSSDPARLEVILNRNPPFGRRLVAQAKSFPEFSLSVSIDSEEILEDVIRANISVDVSITLTDPPPILKKSYSTYAVSILLLTSDGEWIAFKRFKATRLLQHSVSFQTSVDLIKPSQKIVGLLTCEEIGSFDPLISILTLDH
jgi:hypothetical protein